MQVIIWEIVKVLEDRCYKDGRRVTILVRNENGKTHEVTRFFGDAEYWKKAKKQGWFKVLGEDIA